MVYSNPITGDYWVTTDYKRSHHFQARFIWSHKSYLTCDSCIFRTEAEFRWVSFPRHILHPVGQLEPPSLGRSFNDNDLCRIDQENNTGHRNIVCILYNSGPPLHPRNQETALYSTVLKRMTLSSCLLPPGDYTPLTTTGLRIVMDGVSLRTKTSRTYNPQSQQRYCIITQSSLHGRHGDIEWK